MPIACGAAFIALIVALGFVYDYGHTMHARAATAETAAIEDEDIAFCAALGIVQNSEAFDRCKGGLAGIRQSHQERISAAMAGFF